MTEPVRVAIAGPLQAELVDSIRNVDPCVVVAYEPDLLPPTRYPNDHGGVEDFRRSPADERRWWEMIEAAEVLFGIPGDSPAGLASAVRRGPAAELGAGHRRRRRRAGALGGAESRSSSSA